MPKSFLPCLLAAAAALTACTANRKVEFEPGFSVPASRKAPLPLRVGLLLPPKTALPSAATRGRCVFGTTLLAVPYEEEFGRLAYAAAADRFKAVELADDKAAAAGRYDALLELDAPRFTYQPECILQYIAFWQIWPMFTPPQQGAVTVEVSARLLDAGAARTLSEASVSRTVPRTYQAQEAWAEALSAALGSLTSSADFIRYRRTAEKERLDRSERAGDAAAGQGRAAQAVATYAEAYRAVPDADPAKERLFLKLVDAARLGNLAIPAEAQKHADRGQAFVKLASGADGFARAAGEFELAAAAAPWWSEAHFNLGLAREKAGRPREAAASFKRFLLAAPDAPEAADVKQKIVELEVASELSGGSAVEGGDDEEPVPAAPRRAKAKTKREVYERAREKK
ncbi:hypothetical protein EPO15_00190 [bacterium]|nr:MAG: hypothetical protein EPO15_00190 [bacterium]